VRRLLIVEPDSVFRALLEETIHRQAVVETVADFPTARVHLFARPPDLAVTNLRLGAFNGLHLAYLLASEDWPSRGVVYSRSLDVSLAHDARRAGAFWEFQRRLLHVLPAYLDAELPPRDRRDPLRPDRRAAFRGGRRASDVQELASAASELSQRSSSVGRTR
jgi:DNA-binding NtrC family response regulator